MEISKERTERIERNVQIQIGREKACNNFILELNRGTGENKFMALKELREELSKIEKELKQDDFKIGGYVRGLYDDSVYEIIKINRTNLIVKHSSGDSHYILPIVNVEGVK